MSDVSSHVCGSEPHVHPEFTIFGVVRGHVVVMDDAGVAIAFNRDLATRIAELLARHGLVDVPDNAAYFAPAWAPPTGLPRDNHTRSVE